VGLYIAEHYDEDALRKMGVRFPAVAPKPVAAPRAKAPRKQGAADVYASADAMPPHLKGAAEQVRKRDWLKREGTTEAGIRWLTEG
jgi:hypothetical protein